MTVDNPVQMLTHEHKTILKVVHALAAVDADLAGGDTVDPDLLTRVVDFMRHFADQCHHAKEEAGLFPAMEAKGVPKTGCPLSALRAEHVRGHELVTALEEGARAYAGGEPGGVAQIRAAIGGIRHLYPNHIWKEDEMVFPMAERLFSEAELAQLTADFEAAETEFDQTHDQYTAFAKDMERLLDRAHT